MGDLLGGSLEPVPLVESRYGLRVGYSQKKFITMERTIGAGLNGVLTLELAAGGKASACGGLVETHTGSTSKYASHDGKHHRNENESSRLQGFSGTWAHEGAGVRISFDAMVHRQCRIGDEGRPVTAVIELTCYGVEHNQALALDAIACRLEGDGRQFLEGFAVQTSGPRAGSWALRNDPVKRGPLPPADDAEPWLVLATDGILVESRDGARASKPEVRITESDVSFVEKDWIEHYVEQPTDP